MSSATAVVGGNEIKYTDHGSGEPVLLIHAGVFADWFVPLATSHTLEPFRVIRVRRAGYGSTVPASHLTIEDHASHMAALADELGLGPTHVVGHSSGALIAAQLAANRPDLVHTLTLIEPATVGPFQVPAAAEIGERFIGPAMGAFAAGDLQTAFDLFMQGVCGDNARQVLEQSLGPAGYEQAVRESAFFFRDEVPAAMQWQFDTANTITQPVLVVEGGDGRQAGPLSQQVTERATSLFPHAQVALINGTNHMIPLQDPDALGQTIARFAHLHPRP